MHDDTLDPQTELSSDLNEMVEESIYSMDFERDNLQLPKHDKL